MKLLKIEWNKIFYYKAARVFTIIYFLILILVALILANIKPEIGGVKLNIVKMGMFNFPVIWQNIGYIFAIVKIFLGVIIITNVTAEFSNSTLKQNLIDGLTKKEFLTSKMLTNLIFALLSTLFVFGITVSLGLLFSTNTAHIFEGIEFLGAYFLKMMLFFSICLFLAILLKRSAFAFLGLIVLWMAEGGLTLLEFGIKMLMGKSIEDVTPYDFYLTNYLPLNVSSKLVDFPGIKIEGFVMGGTIFNLGSIDISYIIAAVIYFIGFSYLSYWLLKRRDL